MKKHFDLLGMKAEDKVTGFKGVVASLSFDLYGCVQAVLTPPVNQDGKIPDGRYFDVTRLKIKGKKPVMDRPDFDLGYTDTPSAAKTEHVTEGKKGAADKPAPNV